MIISHAHKDFILDMMDQLESYDGQRPDGHAYKFHEHSSRVAGAMKKLALAMNYTPEMADNLYWATLPHDIGKISFPVKIWDYIDGQGKPSKPPETVKKERRAHTIMGADIVRAEFKSDCDTDPFLKLMIDIMENHHETMDGKGFLGKMKNQLSQEIRMACIVDAADGWSILRPHKSPSDITPMAVYHKMSVTNAGQFDNDILEIFKEAVLCLSEPSSSLHLSS